MGRSQTRPAHALLYWTWPDEYEPPNLPAGWRAVPSASRKGEVSYVHAATGFKQARFPTGPPSDSAVEKYRAALKAKSKKRKATAPLLKNAPTANWQSYLKKQGAKR